MGARWYGRIPITITLTAAICTLVLVAVGSVFISGVWVTRNNTYDLLRSNAEQAVTSDTNLFRQHLRPAENMTRFLAEQIADAAIDPQNARQLFDVLSGSLSAVRQIESVIYLNESLTAYLARPAPDGKGIIREVIDKSADVRMQLIMQQVQQGPLWGAPAWNQFNGKTFLNRFHPVMQNGEMKGAVGAVTSVEGLSNYFDQHALYSDGKRFILHGQDHVLAHWLLADGYPGRTIDSPLPKLKSFGDPVLGSIWQREGRIEVAPREPDDPMNVILDVFNDRYAFIYRMLDGYGPEPMIIGAYFQVNDSIKEIQRMSIALIAGIAALCVAVIAAIMLGHRIARPIVRFSAATTRIRDLDVAHIEPLPGSVFRELNDQSAAFNAMLGALRWFELYVPKKLVERLIRQNDETGTASVSRKVSVMFTDMEGFSSLSENMSAADVANLLNHHFSLLADCIERQDGTIDKYIGDAVMAFWGAPDHQPDSAEHACLAALAIRHAIELDNQQRRTEALAPIRLRIGIHTGMATVGNIGAPDRINYTLIGDTVNVGQRLEQLGKSVDSVHEDVIILLSEDTAEELGPTFQTEAIGSHRLKGRAAEIQTYALTGPAFDPARLPDSGD